MKHIKPVSRAQNDIGDTLTIIVSILTALATLIPLIKELIEGGNNTAARSVEL